MNLLFYKAELSVTVSLVAHYTGLSSSILNVYGAFSQNKFILALFMGNIF